MRATSAGSTEYRWAEAQLSSVLQAIREAEKRTWRSQADARRARTRSVLRAPEVRAVWPILIAEVERSIAAGAQPPPSHLEVLAYSGLPADRIAQLVVGVLATDIRNANGTPRGMAGLYLMELLAPYRSRVAPHLVERLDDADPAIRAAATLLLGTPHVTRSGDVGHVARLLRRDPDAVVRLAAANALGMIGPGAWTASGALRRAAERDPDYRVRETAEEALPRVRLTLIR